MNGNSTKVLWDSLTGARLEELLYGLLHEMGAHDIAWRAGAQEGVNATDGGRDIEATFDRPTPEGELDRERWWIEAKGRTRTVERTAVQEAVLGVQPEVDVLVIATNSRFPNSARDWVSTYQKSHPRPKIRLWDKDILERQIEKYPLVVARVMPDALIDEDRLSLLLERWERLGEVPTEVDRTYFWQHQRSVVEHKHVALILIMFIYAEIIEGDLIINRWLSLIDENNSLSVIAATHAQGPARFIRSGSPRHSSLSIMKSMALMWTAAVRYVSVNDLRHLTKKPTSIFKNSDDEGDRLFRNAAVSPLLWNVQKLLGSVCTKDCARVSTEIEYLGKTLEGEKFWNMFMPPLVSSDETYITIEHQRVPCAVGFDLMSDKHPSGTCPLIEEDPEDLERLALDLQKVAIFRADNPTGQYRKYQRDLNKVMRDLAGGREQPLGNPLLDAAFEALMREDDSHDG